MAGGTCDAGIVIAGIISRLMAKRGGIRRPTWDSGMAPTAFRRRHEMSRPFAFGARQRELPTVALTTTQTGHLVVIKH